MVLVAKIKENGNFFRSQTTTESQIEITKATMQRDSSDELEFEIMTERQLEEWLLFK